MTGSPLLEADEDTFRFGLVDEDDGAPEVAVGLDDVDPRVGQEAPDLPTACAISYNEAPMVPEILRAERKLRQYLNDPKQINPPQFGVRWPRVFGSPDPVRIKNLQKAAALLNQFADAASTLWRPQEKVASRVPVILEMLKEIEETTLPSLSGDNAWELADKIERELVHWLDRDRLVVILKGRKDADWHSLATGTLIGKIKDATREMDETDETELGVVVERLLTEEHQGFRRERARMRLRKRYLIAMSICLPPLLFLTAWFYAEARRVVDPYSRIVAAGAPKEEPVAKAAPEKPPAVMTSAEASQYTSYLLFLAAFAGAAGSVLARGRTMNSGTDSSGDASKAAALGIRQLMYEWWTFFAQPVLGATMGVISFLAFHSGLAKLEGLWKEPVGYGPALYALLAFLAGFSEPFFIGILDRVSGQASKAKG